MSFIFRNSTVQLPGRRDWRWLWLRRRPGLLLHCYYGIHEDGSPYSFEVTERPTAKAVTR